MFLTVKCRTTVASRFVVRAGRLSVGCGRMLGRLWCACSQRNENHFLDQMRQVKEQQRYEGEMRAAESSGIADLARPDWHTTLLAACGGPTDMMLSLAASAESPGNVIPRPPVARRGKNPARRIELHELAEIHECRESDTRPACCILCVTITTV